VRTIALVGDYDADRVAHQAIPRALERARAAHGAKLAWAWMGTADVESAPEVLERFAAVWLVPASPYRSMGGALTAVRWARERGRAFLGTCGGFQHAVIEIARDVAGVRDAEHAETSPTAAERVVVPLACSLVGERGEVRFVEGSRLRAICGPRRREGCHCQYGLNAGYRAALEQAGLRFTAFDVNQEVRACEWPAHPFFVGTLFQPERAILHGELHPIVDAFVNAALA
jgi:CTP synthase (UTP-ammonia lyase)